MIWLAAALLIGCELLPTRTTTSDADNHTGGQRPDTFQGLVQYAQWLRKQTPETLKTARGEAEQRARASGGATDQVRLALVLSVPGTSVHDEARARALLEKLLHESSPQDPGLHAFAAMLAANLEDRQWVRERLQRRLSAERQHRERLEHKLEELKDIEQQLHRRDQTDAAAPR